MKPGAVNYITVGIPFAQATSGNAWSSVELLREIDDVCQSLFENCFKVLDGPDAPTLVVQELKNEVILYITYDNPSSNNYNEKYDEEDPAILRSFPDSLRHYKFEGYQIYQLVDANASISDVEKGDETKARLVFQCDLKNFYDADETLPIAKLVNYKLNPSNGLLTGSIKVDGANSGIQHVVRITTDQFATGNNKNLVNNKEYYYIAVAYAHNRFKEYSLTDPNKLDGQKEPYLAGRKNENGGTITAVVAIPHDPVTENNGTEIQATFGMSPNITRIEGFGNGGNVLRISDESIRELMGGPGEPAHPAGTFTETVTNSGANAGSKLVANNPCIITHPLYEQNAGPISVRVIDPLNIKEGRFYIRFTDTTANARWIITRVDDNDQPIPIYDTVMADTADFVISRYNEQLFLDLGIAVCIENPKSIGSPLQVITDGVYKVQGGIINEGSLLSATMTFQDPYHQWLTGIPDNDNYPVYNWIRSGSQFSDGAVGSFTSSTRPLVSVEAHLDEDYYKSISNPQKRTVETFAVDKYQVFEKVLSGTWAPYALCSYLEYHPAFSFRYYLADSTVLDSVRTMNPTTYQQFTYISNLRKTLVYHNNKSLQFNDISKLPSVRIVLTSDTSKWTRCPVLEMCDDYTQSEGNAHRFQMRKHASVDKNGDTSTVAGASTDPGDPNYISDRGMGWFPGYAINLETGERLNVMFGEDSRYAQYNGRDMMWNPVSTVTVGTQNYVMGGRHFIYVMNAINQRFVRYHNGGASEAYYATPSYDAGRWAVKMLSSLDRILNGTPNAEINHGLLKYEGSKWSLPQRDSAAFFFSTVAWVNMPLATETINNPQYDIPCDVTIDLNVNVRYGKCYSPNGTVPYMTGNTTLNVNNPMYMFQLTPDIVTLTNMANRNNSNDYRDSILNLISVVPNPYYSYSAYETESQLQTKVRFINVPSGSTVSIFTVDGTLVRKLELPATSKSTTLDWDLHNHNGLPIAGGIYLIHFKTPIGERVIKWFGTMRPVDLNSIQF